VAATLTGRPLVVDEVAVDGKSGRRALLRWISTAVSRPEAALLAYAPLVGTTPDALRGLPAPLPATGLEHTSCDACGSDDARVLFTAADYRYFTDDTPWTAVQCARCGLGYLNPRPTPAAIRRYYPSHYHDAERIIEGTDERYAREVAHLEGLTPGRLLDIGCARGDFAEAMRRRGWDVAGFDVFDAGNPHGLDLRHGSFPEECTFPDESFDVITAWAVFEHLHRPGAAFAEVARLLGPGGRFVVLVPNARSVNSRFALREDVPRHLHFFSRADIERYAARTGMVVGRYESDGRIYPASGRGAGRLWLWRRLGFSDADFFRMLHASRVERFRRHPVLAWAWHGVAIVERAVLHDEVLRRAGLYGTHVFHLHKPNATAVAGPDGQ
jgi:SAM-dependent methyltransferase